MSLADVAIGLKVFLHTDDKDVYSGFMGRYIFLKEKSVFGDGKCPQKNELIVGLDELRSTHLK